MPVKKNHIPAGKDLSRRKFIQSASVAAAAFTIVPRFVLGKGHRAPSDTLYVAGIGVGGKGNGDSTNASRNAKIFAVCDVDRNVLEKAAKKGAAAPGEQFVHVALVGDIEDELVGGRGHRLTPPPGVPRPAGT